MDSIETEVGSERLNILSLREQVYLYLRDLLSSGQLRPGSMINIDQLSRELGISKTPLKEAIIKLETEGFITIIPRRGMMVNQLTFKIIKNIYEIVGALEAIALLAVFDSLSERHIELLKSSNSDQERALKVGDFKLYYELNINFHDIFLDLFQNDMLQKMTRPLKQRLYDFPRRKYWKHWEDVNLEEHRKFISCLEAKDPHGAAAVWQNEHWGWDKHKPYFKKFYNLKE